MSIAAQEDHIARAGPSYQIEEPLFGLGKVSPFFVRMFARDHLNARSDKVHIGIAAAQLLFEPLPLFRSQHVGGGTRFLPMVPTVQQDDFHSFSRWTKRVGGENTDLLAPRTVWRFVQKIEQEPLALGLVRVLL